MDHPDVQQTFPAALDSGQRSSRTLSSGSQRSQGQSMVMINSDQNAAVTNSTITMAGNNVNNYSVNITLNSKASYGKRREPRTRNRSKPYSRPEPSSSRIRPAQPSTRAMVNEIDNEKEKANEGSSSRTASSSNVTRAGNIEVVSLDHLDIDSHLAKTAGPVRMPHEIYTRQLYSSSHGYACANPKPWGEAVKMGDIGVLSDGGFVVLENLYTLPESFLQGEAVPVIPMTSDQGALMEGDTITGGIDDCTLEMSETQTVEKITMQCHQEEGAALVITSHAELQKMTNNHPLRQYLHKNGPRLFEFLKMEHNFSRNSSLYIVTGSILSASWAIATHGRPMIAPYNTLALRRYVGHEDPNPSWAWTQRASAQVRIGGTRTSDDRDQCLFLRGFLMTPPSADWPVSLNSESCFSLCKSPVSYTYDSLPHEPPLWVPLSSSLDDGGWVNYNHSFNGPAYSKPRSKGAWDSRQMEMQVSALPPSSNFSEPGDLPWGRTTSLSYYYPPLLINKGLLRRVESFRPAIQFIAITFSIHGIEPG